MRRQRGHRQVLGGAFVALLLFGTPTVISQEQMSTTASCVLSSMDLITEDSTTRLVLLTDGPPASLGTRIEPNEGMVLDLASCIPGPELFGRNFDDGLVADLQLVHRDSTLAVVIETRQPFEYSVSSKQDRVVVTLRPAAPPKKLVRVFEPLPRAADTSPSPPEVLQPRAVVQAEPVAATRSDPDVTEALDTDRPTRDSAAKLGPAETTPAPRMAGESVATQIVEGARVSVERAPVYDSSYVAIPYPNGDPGWERGSGVDLIVRAYRQLGIDLQQQIHQDIRVSGVAYGIRKADPHIDHRRVRNLAIFFSRHGQNLAVDEGAEWHAGDIVLWARDKPKTDHVGLISDRLGPSGQPLVIHHNQGAAPEEQDVLHAWPIAGHFRWLPRATELRAQPTGSTRALPGGI